MKKESILFIIPWLPYPPKSGGHQGLLSGIESVKDDFDVFIAYEILDDKDYQISEEGFLKIVPNAHLLPLKNEKAKLNIRILLKDILFFLMNFVRKYFHNVNNESNNAASRWITTVSPLSRRWLNHIAGICQKYDFSIIQVEMPWFISQILTLPESAKKIFVHHELGFVCRELEYSKFVNKNDEYLKACKSYADLVELSLLNLYDAIITVSPVDRDKLLQKGVKIPVYSSFLTIDSPKEIYPQYGDGKQLTFVGPDSHMPNYVGLKWFLDTCWSHLKSIDNGYKLSIIGKWNNANISNISSKYEGVEFLGFVDNLEECLKGTIMIVPITIGSGIRMKILEACSYGVPFISTTVGAEGIPLSNGQHCMIADTPQEFVDGIKKLQDVDLQKSLAANARKLVQEKFSRTALRNNRLYVYDEVCEKHC